MPVGCSPATLHELLSDAAAPCFAGTETAQLFFWIDSR